jgi:peptide/nickel transport system permease protein
MMPRMQSAESRPPARRRITTALVRIAATALAGGLLSATMVRLSPGFGLDEKQLDPTLSRATQEAIRHAHDRERNPLRFYAAYLEHMFAGDLGRSVTFGRPIRELLADRTPVTVGLMVWGIAGAWVLAALLAIPAAAGHSPSLTAICVLLGGIPACLPAAGIAVLLFWLGASAKWMIALVIFPKVHQYVLNLLRHGYRSPHVMLARAKGLRPHRILTRHVLLPARTQFVALAAVSVNLAFGAAVAIEAVADLPGLGQLAWKAAVARDLPVLVVLTLMVTLATQISNCIAELCSPTARGNA